MYVHQHWFLDLMGFHFRAYGNQRKRFQLQQSVEIVLMFVPRYMHLYQLTYHLVDRDEDQNVNLMMLNNFLQKELHHFWIDGN